jgi:glycosyltransferase involved in cell wall biosynthesis
LERTRRYEAAMVTEFDQVLVASPIDRRELRGLSKQPAPVSVLTTGVDIEYFTPADAPREPATLIMTGKMSYHANATAAVHLVRDIMPRVWARRPDVQVWIVGKDPPREIHALASDGPPHVPSAGRSASNGSAALGAQGRVTVTGTVPELPPYLRQATAAVAPIPYGAGVQVKVLESMACGTPVVASPQAVSALRARPGHEVMVADNADAFAQTVLELIDAPARCAELGQAGRAYVEANHGWDAVADQLEGIYQTALREAPGAGGRTA